MSRSTKISYTYNNFPFQLVFRNTFSINLFIFNLCLNTSKRNVLWYLLSLTLVYCFNTLTLTSHWEISHIIVFSKIFNSLIVRRRTLVRVFLLPIINVKVNTIYIYLFVSYEIKWWLFTQKCKQYIDYHVNKMQKSLGGKSILLRLQSNAYIF